MYFKLNMKKKYENKVDTRGIWKVYEEIFKYSEYFRTNVFEDTMKTYEENFKEEKINY